MNVVITTYGPFPQSAPSDKASLLRILAGTLPIEEVGERLQATVLAVTPVSALLEVQGTQVEVEPQAELQPGMQLTVRVAGNPARPLLQLLPAAAQRLAGTPALQVGQLAVARVVQQLPDQRIVLDVEGNQYEAEPPKGEPLPAQFPIRVAQLGPTPEFHIVRTQPNVESQATQLLVSRLADRAPADQTLGLVQTALEVLSEQSGNPAPAALAQLQDLLNELLPQGSPWTSERIAQFVQDSGLQYEAKLQAAVQQGPQALAEVARHDIKGLLLQTLQELENQPAAASHETKPFAPHANASRSGIDDRPSSPRPELAAYRSNEAAAHVSAGRTSQPASLMAPLTQHLNNIEAQQALNLIAQARGEAFQLPIPFPTAQGMATALLAVEPDGRGSGDEEEKDSGHHILLMFDLDSLGPTRIDATLDSNNLRAVFYVQNTDALGVLRAELPAFKDRLHALGYRHVLLDARPINDLSPEKRCQFDALVAGLPGSTSLIDGRA
jgi:hypothetical protein